jgi:hypothetical protein
MNISILHLNHDISPICGENSLQLKQLPRKHILRDIFIHNWLFKWRFKNKRWSFSLFYLKFRFLYCDFCVLLSGCWRCLKTKCGPIVIKNPLAFHRQHSSEGHIKFMMNYTMTRIAIFRSLGSEQVATVVTDESHSGRLDYRLIILIDVPVVLVNP